MSAAIDVRLYGIADPARCAGDDLAGAVRRAADGGATLIQLRDKNSTTRSMIDRARAIKATLEGTGVGLIVNDRVDVALAAGADGVHLGADDMAPETARSLMGDKAIIGVTVHDAAEAAAIPVDVADYVGAGPVFETASKDDAVAAHGLSGFADLVAAIRTRAGAMPIAGIAGIDRGNAAAVIAAGADGVAVISALFLDPDPEEAARALRLQVEDAFKERGR